MEAVQLAAFLEPARDGRNLALGIGIQNFPEGLAVSLPLQSAGFSVWRAFWYGQLSGMVEPVFGVLGAVAVAAAKPVLPYALAFAAGAMIYVVADDIIPEANASGNGKLATWGCIVGFMVMMCLDRARGAPLGCSQPRAPAPRACATCTVASEPEPEQNLRASLTVLNPQPRSLNIRNTHSDLSPPFTATAACAYQHGRKWELNGRQPRRTPARHAALTTPLALYFILLSFSTYQFVDTSRKKILFPHVVTCHCQKRLTIENINWYFRWSIICVT
ncbi:unnamed protein product, partial [Brenthis ino]